MEVTILAWAVALAGLLLFGLLAALQVVAVRRPGERWTIDNVELAIRLHDAQLLSRISPSR